MQVRVFESPDMATGLRLVRRELGPDALILSTRTLKNGKLGLLGKSTVEITAAIDSPWPNDEQRTTEPPPRRRKKRSVKSSSRQAATFRLDTYVGGDDIRIDYGADDAVADTDKDSSLITSPSPSSHSIQMNSASEASLKEEVNELRGLIQLLAGRMTETDDSPPTTHPLEQGTATSAGSNALRERLIRMKTSSDPVIKLLTSYGVHNDTAATIAEFAREQFAKKELQEEGKIRHFVIKTLENLIEVNPPLFAREQDQQRLAFIGPTGVGKTTTLAKLAALYLSGYSNSIALITIDTYRIAAVEQLKVYGEIMHLPVDVVITPEQLALSLERHADKSLVLIDTAGRSPNDSLSIEELRSFFRPDFNIEKHLVLSATTRESELLDSIKHFNRAGVDRTIFTKIDECTTNGAILNVQMHNKAPLSYITNGQRVPEDLLQITRRSVAELIMSHHRGTRND